jgi:hypothetical protein
MYINVTVMNFDLCCIFVLTRYRTKLALDTSFAGVVEHSRVKILFQDMIR